MIRAANASDIPAILDFLAQHEATSMFPMGNLLGLGPATESWIFGSEGRIEGYLGLTASGILLPQAPDADWSLVRPLLEGRTIAGLVGPADQCDGLARALGLADAPARLNAVEAGFTLELSNLQMPQTYGFALTPIRESDLPLICDWRAAALVETQGFTPETAMAEARRDVQGWQAAQSHRILWRDGKALSMAGVTARIPQVVQIGGVYTPSVLRNQGHARRAVAMLLDEARQSGIRRAVLFAMSDHAVRAYTAIGFRPSHNFSLRLFATLTQVTA